MVDSTEAVTDEWTEIEPSTQTQNTTIGLEKDTEFDLENARAFGAFYSSLIESLAGESEMKDAGSFNLDETDSQFAQNMLAAIKAEEDAQHSRMEIKGWGGKELLEQIRSDEEAKALLTNSSQYRMQEFSKGIYGVFVSPGIYSEFAPSGSQATAVKPLAEEGVSFVIIREFVNEQDGEINEKQLKENIPHEIHHIVWSFLQKHGIIAMAENDLEKQKAFSMYQDELVAKLVSNGPMLGYTHLERMTKEQREKIEQEQPNTSADINQISGEMYDYLKEELEPAIESSEVSKQDCLLAVAKATTFSELKDNLKQMENIIREHPKMQKPSTEASGWGLVS